MAEDKDKDVEKQIIREDLHQIKIFLASKDLRALERVCAAVVAEARKTCQDVKGPHRLPRKRFRINTRKSPCGEGTNTYETWELRVYKRRIDFLAHPSVIRDVTRIGMDPKVNIELTVTEL